MPIIKIHSTVKVFEIIGILKINYELSIFGTLVQIKMTMPFNFGTQFGCHQFLYLDLFFPAVQFVAFQF